uniref:SEX1 n=1 Tax=Arundo donax TaxID=35708 RepID=A0A0A8Z1P2_ARUDO
MNQHHLFHWSRSNFLENMQYLLMNFPMKWYVLRYHPNLMQLYLLQRTSI